MSISTITQAEQVLVELAEQFTRWRQQRARRHERIPMPLWDQAVALTQVLPNGRVAKALRLSATDLKQHGRARETMLAAPTPERDPRFIFKAVSRKEHTPLPLAGNAGYYRQ